MSKTRKHVLYPQIHPDLPALATRLEHYLPPATKKLWVKNLRSGDYTQARDALHKNDSFCVLGVFANQIDAKAWIARNPNIQPTYYSWHGWRGFLSWEYIPVLAKTALLQPMPNGSSVSLVLSIANDRGATFEQLALWIERYL